MRAASLGCLLLGAITACSLQDQSFTATLDAAPAPDAASGLRIVLDPADRLEVREGNNAVVQVVLSGPPEAPLTVDLISDDPEIAFTPERLTFDAGSFDVAQPVEVTAAEDEDTIAGSASIQFDADDEAGAVPSVDLPVAIEDNDTLRLVVSPDDQIDIGEQTSANIQVSLSAPPLGDLVVTATALDPGAVQVGPTGSFTFDLQNWDQPHTFTVAGVNDDDTSAEATSVTFAADGVDPVSVDVGVTDSDVLNIQVSPGTLPLTEGGAAGTVMVSLTQQPPADLTVAVALVGDGVTLSTGQLGFSTTDWSTPKPLTVTPASDDDLADETPTVQLSCTSPLLATQSVNVTVDDDDQQAIQIAATNPFGLAEDGSNTFTVRLAYRPASTVTVTVATTDSGAATAGPNPLTFEPGAFASTQLVTVTGVADADLASETLQVRLQSSAAPTVDLPTTVTDDDSQSIVVSASDVTVPEGATASFTVRLGYVPPGSTTVTTTSPSGSVTVTAGASLAFLPGNYSTPRTVTLSAPVDIDTDGEVVDLTVESPASGAAPVTVRATITDATVVADLGWPTYFGSNADVEAGEAYAYKLNVAQATTFASFGLYAGAAGGSFKMALYSEPGDDEPGTLVVAGDTAAPITQIGRNLQDLADVPLAPGNYWLVFKVDPGASIGVSSAATTRQCRKFMAFSGGWPTSFGTVTCSPSQLYNIFIVTYRQG